jgi:hypothetical protein
MKKIIKPPKMPLVKQFEIARQVIETRTLANHPIEWSAECSICSGTKWRGTWADHWHKFQKFLSTGIPQFSLFIKGNDKLPFQAWSALPVITCPGMGDCANWCYSFGSLRNPAVFFRLLQNTILMLDRSPLIWDAYQAIKEKDVRWFVDGDINSMQTLEYLFELVSSRPDITAYGYSKSWELFLAYSRTGKPFPNNYELNTSSGSKYSDLVRRQMAKLPIWRGDFIALPSAHKMPDRRTDPKAYRTYAAELKQTAKANGIAKAFVCPGKCGDCLPTGHACGSKSMKGVSVIIGIH